MKKKLLFIAPGYYGFNEVVFDGLKKYSTYEVVHINSTLNYQYKNIWEKIYNFFLKKIFKKNIKHIKQGEHIQRIINSNYYDVILVNRPDVLSESNLNSIFQKSKKTIFLLWDSIEKIPSQKEYINKFDICYSFDPEDCKKYSLKHITNFYFANQTEKDIRYDIGYLATYDKRIKETIILFNYFKKKNISVKARIFAYKSTSIKEKLPLCIEIIHKIIPFSNAYKYYFDCKIILDLAHPNQKGLSFRPYEAIGLNKKLITTNQEIVNYDFYNPNNIFVINDIENFSIPESFINSEYQQPAERIKEKYYIKNWIKNILSFNEN